MSSSTVESAGVKPPADAPTQSPVGFGQELRDAVSRRTFLLLIGVLILQMGFVLSYVGSFHHPVPHEIPISVVAPSQVSDRVVAELNGLPGRPLTVEPVADEAAARRQLTEGKKAAAFVVNLDGSPDVLLVASARGASAVTAVEEVFGRVDAAADRSVRVVDVVPLEAGDNRGLTGFYLVIGWCVGGYLVATLLGIAKGARPANRRRAVIRLLAVSLYAIISGLGGAVIVGPLLGALTGSLIEVAAIGALLVLAAAAVTMAFEVLFGILGVGLTLIVFVILGNPSAGGAYAPELLPTFWRSISPVLPNSAATSAVREVVYFGGRGVAGDLLVLAAYAVFGIVATLLGSSRHRSPAVADPLEAR